MSIHIRDKMHKVYMIVGNPKSATSFIAKCLQDAGVDIGSDLGKDTYEDVEFYKLNKKILNAAGGSWDNPPSEESIMRFAGKDWIRQHFLSKRKKHKWGFKDPRNALTGKLYLPYLYGDAYLICCFRKPDKVAKSLGRDKKVVDEYNRRIISLIKEFVGLSNEA